MTTFHPQHARRSAVITLDAPPDAVFPLFGPVREAEWAKDWAITVVHAQTPLLEEEGAVFTTHLPDDQPTIWLVTRYKPEDYRIDYARITPGSRAVRVLIACKAAPDQRTAARITYEITALSEAGNEYVAHFTEASYQHMMALWERAINHRLHTGETLARHS